MLRPCRLTALTLTWFLWEVKEPTTLFEKSRGRRPRWCGQLSQTVTSRVGLGTVSSCTVSSVSSNLRDLLVKAQLPVISTNHFPPGSFRCGQNCATCPYITNGLTSYTFYATGETRSITSHITCNTKNVIYMVQCNRCNLQ